MLFGFYKLILIVPFSDRCSRVGCTLRNDALVHSEVVTEPGIKRPCKPCEAQRDKEVEEMKTVVHAPFMPYSI